MERIKTKDRILVAAELYDGMIIVINATPTDIKD